MTMTKAELHQHEYKNPKLIRLPVDDRKEQFAFKGETMGMVIKACECGEDVATDYGKYNDLLKKYDKKGSKRI